MNREALPLSSLFGPRKQLSSQELVPSLPRYITHFIRYLRVMCFGFDTTAHFRAIRQNTLIIAQFTCLTKEGDAPLTVPSPSVAELLLAGGPTRQHVC